MEKTINFAVLGTCVGSEAIIKAKEKNWKILKNFISFSLMAIVDSYNANKAVVTETDIFSKERWPAKDLLDDINGNIIRTLKETAADLYIIDLCDFRLAETVVELCDGRKIFYTYKPFSEETEQKLCDAIEKHYGASIKSKTIVFFNNLSLEKQRNYVKRFLRIIYEELDKDKVLIIEPRLIIEYLHENQIKMVNNISINSKINYLIKVIYGFLKESEYIKCPSILIGDTSFATLFEFHYCQPYYEYIKESIVNKLDKQENDINSSHELFNKCDNKIHGLYHSIICQTIYENSIKKLIQIKKNIVLIAKSDYFGEILKSKSGCELRDYIYYDSCSDLLELEKRVVDLRKKIPDCFFVVPEVFYHGERLGIQKIFSDQGWLPNQDYFVYSPSIVLSGFEGVYRDIYNNIIVSESKINLTITSGVFVKIGKSSTFRNHKIHVCGNGTLNIGDSVKAHDGVIYVGHNSVVSIGSDSEISDSDIRSHNRTKITIGKDCLFSYKQMIYSSDGHAIFDVCGKEKKCTRLNNPNNDTINIGDHVWIGYRCHILTGCDIGSGSIAGAGSLLNKKYPNNCIVAGVPAKIIKKDKAWSKNPYYIDLEKDKNVYNNYTNLTEGDSDLR